MIIPILIIILAFIHYLRWLAIIQQKEYRFDRYILFLRSKEGLRDFFLPFPLTLNRPPNKTDLKRPKITKKILLIILTSLIFIAFSFNTSVIQNKINLNLFLIFLYLKVPTTIFLSSLPATIITKIITLIEIKKAKSKLAKTTPLIIGITGSYGKSSTKFLLHHLLSINNKVFTTPSSYNTIYSVAHSINTSYQNEPILILEYGAYTKNEIKILAKHFKPEIALITGITKQHLGLFKSLENIIKAKSELIKALHKNGIVFYNGEDQNVQKMILDSANQKFDYSKIELSNVEINQEAKLSFNYNNKKINLALTGKHYLINIKAAIALAEYFKIPEDQIINSLKTFKPNGIFINSFINKQGALIIDDGRSSNPKGFLSAIQLIKEMNYPHNIILTSGIVDLGIESREIHSKLAKESQKVFSKILFPEITGRKEFEEIFENNLIKEKNNIINTLKNLDQNTVLLIEGKIKKEYLNSLK